MKVKEFIEQHKYICYCEAILHPDGSIEYARPSHIETLIRITKLSRKEIDNLMPITATPIRWLVEHTKCIALWYDFYIGPEVLTECQESGLHDLISAKIIKISKEEKQ